MATKHAWNSLKSGGSGGGNDQFMRLMPDSKNKFRPLGDPVVFWRYYVNGPDGKMVSAITDDPEICVVAQKHGITPRKRGAINVIDRQDGKLKILETAYGVFSDIKSICDGETESPGGSDGHEFGVKVEIPGGNKKMTKYKVLGYGPSPITAAEKAMIKETGPNGKIFDLEEKFAATPQDEIEAKLGLATFSSKKSNASFDEDDAPAPKKVAAKKPAEDDDLDF